MARVDSNHNHTWRLRLKLLNAMHRTTPRVFQSLRDGLPKLKLPSPYMQVSSVYKLHSEFDLDGNDVGRWEKWPPTIWASKRFDSIIQAVKAIDDWAAYWNMGTDHPAVTKHNGQEKVETHNWFKSYALRLCAY